MANRLKNSLEILHRRTFDIKISTDIYIQDI